MKTWALILLPAFLITGCSVISKNTLKQVDTSITLPMVQANPGQFIGRKVVWGGTIISSQNLEKTTEIEVLESTLAYDYTPEDGDSRGRFIIESDKYLDTKVYKPSARITVAGTIKDVETRKIGKMDYHFPVITPIEMKLSEKPPEVNYPAMSPYGPYGPYSPMTPYPWPAVPPGPFPPYRPYPYPYPYPWPY